MATCKFSITSGAGEKQLTARGSILVSPEQQQLLVLSRCLGAVPCAGERVESRESRVEQSRALHSPRHAYYILHTYTHFLCSTLFSPPQPLERREGTDTKMYTWSACHCCTHARAPYIPTLVFLSAIPGCCLCNFWHFPDT